MRVLVLLLLLAVSFSAYALQSHDGNGRICAPFRGGVVDPAIVSSMLRAAEDGRLYRIKEKSSNVGFCVDSAIGRVEAKFSGVQGGFALRREVWGDESQMLVMVDTHSLAMEKCFIRDMLMGEHFLDTYTYPRILFVSSGLRWLDHEKVVLEGMLTMHGVTRPIRFNVKVNRVPNKNPHSVSDIIVTASSFINRADFGMDRLSFMVSDKIELCMRIEASLFKK